MEASNVLSKHDAVNLDESSIAGEVTKKYQKFVEPLELETELATDGLAFGAAAGTLQTREPARGIHAGGTTNGNRSVTAAARKTPRPTQIAAGIDAAARKNEKMFSCATHQWMRNHQVFVRQKSASEPTRWSWSCRSAARDRRGSP